MNNEIYKIALVGSSGYISRHIINELEHSGLQTEIIRIDMTDDVDLKLELASPETFDYDFLKDTDYIIFTAAISSPDKCAQDFDACWNINVIGTNYFINKALNMGKRVLFFSSDAVFGDIPYMIYNEASATQAQTAYGRMKKAVEDEFKSCKGFKCIRLSYVVSENDRFISYCLNCVRNNEVADIFHPFYRNCITVTDVIRSVVWLIQNWSEFDSFALNLAGPELVSRVRMADEINWFFQNRLRYTISSPGEGFYNNRPKITQICSNYLYELGIIKHQSFTDKFRIEIQKIKL